MFLRICSHHSLRSTLRHLSSFLLLPLLVAAGVLFTPVLVKDINPNGDAYPDFMTPAGDAVYFYADTGQGRQLFVADDGGATQLTSIAGGIGCIFEEPNKWPIVVSDAVYFTVTKGELCTGDSIWRTDGSPAGTQLVVGSPGFSSIHAADVGFYALGGDGSDGVGIWYSSGTPAGTQLVQGGFDPASVYMYAAGVLDNEFYFLVQPFEDSSLALWRADTASATELAALPLESFIGSQVYAGKLYLYGTNGEVWRIAAGSSTPEQWQNGSAFHGFISRSYASGDRLYLVDWDTVANTNTLWRYDGAAGKLEEIVTYNSIRGLAGMGDSVYFAAETYAGPPLEGSVLLRLPLTSTEPAAVSPEFALTGDKSIDRIATDGEFLYLRVFPARGVDLWVSDGSAGGTQRVTTITNSLNNWKASVCPCIVPAGSAVYFDRQDAATGVEPWRLERIDFAERLYLPHLAH